MRLNKLCVLQILIVLLMLNYMIVTVIFNDFLMLKILRDIVLLLLIVLCIDKNNFRIRENIFEIIIVCVLLITMLLSDDIQTALLVLRRYCFPLLLLICVQRMEFDEKKYLKKFSGFIAIFFMLLSLWGILQALILQDDFLINLGYSTQFLYEYGEEMLGYSFYFGGLGIQRVVSTLSNSNICGTILGTTLIFLICIYPQIEINERYKKVILAIITTAYIFTFSRSNFLALLCILPFIFRYIPYKKKIVYICGILGLICVLLYFIQGEQGIIYKLVEWVINSLTLQESSAAGRWERWAEAIDTILANPLGKGFGYVGSLARDLNVSNYLSVENSYFAMAIDMGIFGAVIYILFLINIITILCKAINKLRIDGRDYELRICMSAKMILIYFMIVCFFSNHIYDMELISVVYTYVGISLCLLRRIDVIGENKTIEVHKTKI